MSPIYTSRYEARVRRRAKRLGYEVHNSASPGTLIVQEINGRTEQHIGTTRQPASVKAGFQLVDTASSKIVLGGLEHSATIDDIAAYLDKAAPKRIDEFFDQIDTLRRGG